MRRYYSIEPRAVDYVQRSVLASLDCLDYGVKTPTCTKAKADVIRRIFEAEKSHEIARVGPEKALIDWLQGLPTCIGFTWESSEIIALGEQLSYLDGLSCDDDYEDFIIWYWDKLLPHSVGQAIGIDGVTS